MDIINFQPKGVYQPFASKQTQTNSFKPTIKEPADTKTDDEIKKSKLIKYAKFAALIGVAIGGYFLHKGYKEKVDAMYLRDKVLSGIKTRAELEEFLDSEPFSTVERLNYIKIWNDHDRYKTGMIGTIDSFFKSISNFFKNNFYNY